MKSRRQRENNRDRSKSGEGKKWRGERNAIELKGRTCFWTLSLRIERRNWNVGCMYGSSERKTLGVLFRQDQTRMRSDLYTKGCNSIRRNNNPCPAFALLQHRKNKKVERMLGSLHCLYEGKFYYRYYDLYDCNHKCAQKVISGVDAFAFVQ